MADGIPARLTAADGRRFGIKVGVAFLVLGGVAWWRRRLHVVVPFEAVGALLLLCGLLVPARLGPVYKAWMGLGNLLSRVTTPIFLGVVFYVVLTPVGLLMRMFGAAPLPRSGNWVPRAPETRQRTDMARQF